mgnify:CR=1 FL=1
MPDTPPLRPRSPGKKPKQKNPAKSPKIVVPADDLKIKVAQAQKLADALTAKKKATIKQSKLDANEKYQAGLADLGERIDGALVQRGAERFGKQRLEQAHAPLAGKVAQGRQRRVADATLRSGHGAQESRVVVLVHQQP